MDRFQKIQDIAFAALFGVLGVTALVAAVFFGATHQYAMAVICAVMVTAAIAEIRREERKAKSNLN